ncbi:MAG: Trk system potassium transporter TrkA [Candidatus Thermoplasmatota archaeon]|nr:Trk system potassium transporter TrkA [Candidatus Thermoplasmatota archaeon]MBU4071403.1 Trk system potassium transporter TrkA [Candidatus Thermoplasmatota archaeon]MBU4143507.1 Trk system potassium transporter TrkA [Candidatus Thermoplasmatota archaeon]MBU4591741.1 Trk system potassium transporter TrkA [Candidatus Thermoplasmatota archaeon]
MYVVIAGAGHVGAHIAEALLEQGHSVAVIESDMKRFENIEAMDVLAIHGNAASPKNLADAGINSANMLVAVTGSDETNIIACVIGKSKGCKTIARLRSPDYLREGVGTGNLDVFGMDLVVSPDVVTANHISRSLLLPSLVESGELSEGQSLIIELRLSEGNPTLRRMLGSIQLPPGAIICSVSRNGQLLLPERVGPLELGDRIILVLDSRMLVANVETAFGVTKGGGTAVGGRLETGIDKIVIVGATKTGIQVAKKLENEKAMIVMDTNTERCQHARDVLEKAIVIHGDATDSALFIDEGLGDASVLVATTKNTDFNMLSCLLAKKRGVTRTMAIVDEPELKLLFEQIGVDMAVSPRMMTVDFILQNILGKQISSTQTTLHGSGITVLEVLVKDTLWMVGKEFGNIKFPRGAFVGSVIRGGKAIKPTRFDTIMPGDRIIMMAPQDSLHKVEKLFSYHSGTWRFR